MIFYTNSTNKLTYEVEIFLDGHNYKYSHMQHIQSKVLLIYFKFNVLSPKSVQWCLHGRCKMKSSAKCLDVIWEWRQQSQGP